MISDLTSRKERRYKLQYYAPQRSNKTLRVNALLDFFSVPFEPGHGFWERHAGRLDILMFDARKSYMAMVRKYHEAGTHPDAAMLKKVNGAWEQLQIAMRKHGVEC